MKTQIIEQLGQTDVLLPALIADGLAANDRVKVRLSVLQAAGRHARAPNGARFDLTGECHAAGIDPLAVESLVNGASLTAGDQIAAPGLSRLVADIWDDVTAMIGAVKAGDAAQGDTALQRLATIKSAGPSASDDTVSAAHIGRLTGLSGENGDSLHRLIMDMHKALNRLSEEHAEEVLAGAHVYGLEAGDRPAVEALCAALNRPDGSNSTIPVSPRPRHARARA